MASENGSRNYVGTDMDPDEEDGSTSYHGQVEIIPQVRKCDLVNFKNRFNAAEEGLYAVDVLEFDSLVDQEELQEGYKIREIVLKNRVKAKTRTLNSKPKLFENGDPSKFNTNSPQVIAPGKSKTSFISRIRIQGPAILSILSKIMQESWGSRPRTFIRPFSPLIYFHPQLVEFLRELELRWGHHDEGSKSSGAQVEKDNLSKHAHDGDEASLDDSPMALAELRCYVEFMTNEILPLYSQFETLNEKSTSRMRFHDLWYLFRVGELIYRPVGGGGIQEINGFSLGQRTWRVFAIRHGITSSNNRSHIRDNDGEFFAFEVDCYYIDYTGEEYCAVVETFKIHAYEGERPIKSLRVFPYRFLSNHEEKLEMHKMYGKRFLERIDEKHSAYNWWTVIRTTTGDPTTDAEGNELKRSDYIDSEVVIDFVEAFQTCPSWKPTPSILKPQEPRKLTIIDDLHTSWWSDSRRTKLLAETTEIILLRSGISEYERNKNLTEDHFLDNIRKNGQNGRLTTREYLLDSDLPLLPCRVFGYALRDRKFVQLDVYGLSPVKISRDGFDCLKIKPDHKKVISSLVEDHFMKKSTERKDGVERMSLDWIKGKGKGLFILLHGVPGVGKTATAEAVAQASGKPLFAITCGDLGLTPTEVELALRRIFRLANAWDCVLLLDEVDTFFSQRSKGDVTLTKNALVSVFLRVLEYYDGLLFMTTNRPGAVDEAFKSRIHLTLYYPPLNKEQTIDIWKMNIQRLRQVEEERCKDTDLQPLEINRDEILWLAAEKFHERNGKSPWNGRQIRNAIQIASSLAHFDARRNKTQPKLTTEHFQMIHDVTKDFNDFMLETVGKTDSELAFERGDRSDHWIREDPRATPVQHYAPAPLFTPGASQFGGGNGIGRRNPSITGRRPSSSFDRSPDEPPNYSRVRIPSSNHTSRRQLSLARPPSVPFNPGSELEFGHGDRDPRRGYSSNNGYVVSQGNEDISPHDTYELDDPRRNYADRKHGLESPEYEHRTSLKKRRDGGFEDFENKPS
ncbi:aaa family ATPase [Rhexocercosporidium sp. MPI-PUGE-AT-0058]|nr:aaa family ATPase [Rhexocercosporidium sp. MPI-PUGE-AT-0058]